MKRRQVQFKIGLDAEMRAELDRAAAEQGHTVADEIRARITSFKEDHRLVEVRMLVPKSELGKTQ